MFSGRFIDTIPDVARDFRIDTSGIIAGKRHRAGIEKILAASRGETNVIKLSNVEYQGDEGVRMIADLIKQNKLVSVEMCIECSEDDVRLLKDAVQATNSKVQIKIKCLKTSNHTLDIDEILRNCPNIECTVKELTQNYLWVTRIINKRADHPAASASAAEEIVAPKNDCDSNIAIGHDVFANEAVVPLELQGDIFPTDHYVPKF